MTTTTLNINDTSKSTGLSPSVLRMWELRHGWPRPNRQTNGYRTYQPHLVADLQRAADYVKGGIPIRKLIVDGLPRWPVAPIKTTRLSEARAIAAPPSQGEVLLRDELLDALEGRRVPMVRHLLERIFWTVRPRDEALTALAPALVAIAELQRDGRPLAEADALLELVRDRCDSLLRMQPRSPDPLLVVPARESDQALAALTALVLCFRGIPAKRWTGMGEPNVACIVAADGGGQMRLRHQIAALSTLAHDGHQSLADLVDPSRTLDWLETLTR